VNFSSLIIINYNRFALFLVLQTLLGYLHLLKQQVNSFFKFETLNFFKLHFVDSFFQYQHNNEKKNQNTFATCFGMEQGQI